jgi:hypothetical protein
MEHPTPDLGHSIVPMEPSVVSLIPQVMCTKANGSMTEHMATEFTSVLLLVAVTKANGLMTCRMARGPKSGKTAPAMKAASNVARRKESAVSSGPTAQSSLGSGEATRFKALGGRYGLMAADMLESSLRT